MEFDLSYVISFLAILVIGYCLILTVSLKKDIPGGMVGKKWNFLTILVAMFTVGFLTTPFFGRLPFNILKLIVSFIFLFGAVYVLITIRLIYTIIKELSE